MQPILPPFARPRAGADVNDPTAISDEKNPLLILAHQKGYTPKRSDTDALLDLFLRAVAVSAERPDDKRHEEKVRVIVAALDRVSDLALARGLARLSTVQGIARRSLCAQLSRWAVLQGTADDAAFLSVLPLVDDADPLAARQVVIALGRAAAKLSPTQADPLRRALLARLQASEAASSADVRAWVEALGKLPLPAQGSDPAMEPVIATARQVLQALQARPYPPVVAAAIATALTRYQRDLLRREVVVGAPAIDVDAPLPADTQLVLHCRAGLLPFLRTELRERGLLQQAQIVSAEDPADVLRSYTPQTSGQLARLVLQTTQPLSHWQRARLYSSLRFLLPNARLASTPSQSDAQLDDQIHLIAATIASPTGQALLSHLSLGLPRYRLSVQLSRQLSSAASGTRSASPGTAVVRPLPERIAQAVQRLAPSLHNDPIASPWQVEVTGSHARDLHVELVPRALQTSDPRFAYRRRDVPAASHPPLAAAMARLLAAGPQDVVWDPFVGSGSELIEVALLGRGPRLCGTDLDPEASAVARENIQAAGLPATQVLLRTGDALDDPPPRISRIVTNPPMGRRTRPGHLADFLSRFLAHVADILPVGGRLVWISPQPNLSLARGRELGLTLRTARPIDLNGFWGQLEVWDQTQPVD